MQTFFSNQSVYEQKAKIHYIFVFVISTLSKLSDFFIYFQRVVAFDIKMILQASSHQGNQKFRGRGKQCMSNSVCAIVASFSRPPSQWTLDTMDNILQNGDDLYAKTICSKSFWSTDDIPASVNSVDIVKFKHFHGTINRETTEHPFYTIQDAFTESFAKCKTSHTILTMGNCEPCYSCAIIQEEGQLYFYDPHSRSSEGMPVSDGFAALTFHQNIEVLVTFIKCLANSLSPNGGDMTFEMVELAQSPSGTVSDSSTEFSGFSYQSEGDITCQLYLAEERVKKVMEEDVSDMMMTMRMIWIAMLILFVSL